MYNKYKSETKGIKVGVRKMEQLENLKYNKYLFK